MTKKHHQFRTIISNGIRDRLEELRRERGLNYSQFARAAGVPLPQYNAWRNSGVVPGGAFLKQMAVTLGVTVDWLLCIEGARKRPGQSLPDVEIEKEVAAYVRGAIAAGLAGASWAQGVSIVPIDDMPRVGRRVVDLGVHHLLSELYERLRLLADGEPVKFPDPFRVRKSGLRSEERAVLRKALVNAAPPWPGLSTQLLATREVTDEADLGRQQPHTVVAAVLGQSTPSDRDARVHSAASLATVRSPSSRTAKGRKSGKSESLR